MGRNSQPTYAIIDSQIVKIAGDSKERGVDGGKNVKGRKGHIVTDSQGHLLYILVDRANIHDTIAGKEVLQATREKYPSIEGISADAGYRKTTENFVIDQLKKTISIAQRISNEWIVLAKRWIAQRTFAWFNIYRRMSKDYEMTTRSAEAFAMIAHSALLLKRLAQVHEDSF